MKRILAWLSAVMVICTTALGANASGLAAVATPSTGDNSMSIIIPIVVLAAAAVVVVVLVLLKKKKG